LCIFRYTKERAELVASAAKSPTKFSAIYKNLMAQPQSLDCIWRHFLRLMQTSNNERLLQNGMIRDCSSFATGLLGDMLPSLQMQGKNPSDVNMFSVFRNAIQRMKQKTNRTSMMNMCKSLTPSELKQGFNFAAPFAPPEVLAELQAKAAECDEPAAVAATPAAPAAASSAS
jgi:hypothetical protein